MAATSTFNQIPPEELNFWMKEKRDFLLIHILTNDHFEKVHIPGAKNACVFEVTFLDQMRDICSETSAEIVLCGSSVRSMDALMAAEKLSRAGYQNIHVLKGGIDAWRSDNLPLEGEAPDAPAALRPQRTPDGQCHAQSVSARRMRMPHRQVGAAFPRSALR